MCDVSVPSDMPDDDVLARFRDLTADADLDTLRALAVGLLAGQESEPDRRRPRPAHVTRYTLRITLDDTDVWRRVDVRSDLTLDVVHEVVQEAMGWTDSHLHQFVAGDSPHDRHSQRFLTPFDVEEGDVGVLEREVHLDELLQAPGDALFYAYDFGDGWDHTVRLEAVTPWADATPVAVCTGGERACPPEDCGGVSGYEDLLRLAAERTAGATLDPEDAERLAWWAGDDDLPARELLERAARFDPADVDLSRVAAVVDLPGPVAELVRRVTGPERDVVGDLVARARLTRSVEINADLAAAHVADFRWLLTHVGPDGLPLTSAGYMRPADVEAAANALGIADEWIGTLNRESHTLPVLQFREVARTLGLVRVTKKHLSLTRLGRTLTDDPIALWWHLAARLPLEKTGFARDVALVSLLCRAAGRPVDRTVADVVRGLGWRQRDGSEIAAHHVRTADQATQVVLVRMGLLPRSFRRDATVAHPGLATFARAALQRWR